MLTKYYANWTDQDLVSLAVHQKFRKYVSKIKVENEYRGQGVAAVFGLRYTKNCAIWNDRNRLQFMSLVEHPKFHKYIRKIKGENK